MFPPSTPCHKPPLAVSLGSCVLASIVFATGCFGPDAVPQLRASIAAERHVIQHGETVEITITFSNDGPGAALVGIYCPSFEVRNEAGEAVGPGVTCLSIVGPRPVLMEPGAQHVVDATWNGKGNDGGTVFGRFTLIPNARAATDGDTLVPIEFTPISVEVVR